MFIVQSYHVAVLLSIVTMICWGSWANTQKLASKTWRYELFYWDYVIGIVLIALVLGFTMGSIGSEGRPFIEDLSQASKDSLGWVLLGGVVFNASNILLSASTALAGMAVAFPLGVGIALVLGVTVNYLGEPSGNPTLLFLGVGLIVLAIICNGIASSKTTRNEEDKAKNRKGIIIAFAAGILMSLFYRFVIKGMDVNNFASPTAGMLTPYSAVFVFSIGVFLSNFIFNSLVMRFPFSGERVNPKEYFRGGVTTHLTGILGGVIWGLGTAFSYIAAEVAGPAVSYALGQGAPMIAAIWGVFIWKEFKGASNTVNWLLGIMFLLFITGLAFIVVAGQG